MIDDPVEFSRIVVELSNATSSKIGDEYFNSVVQHLAESLNMDIVFIGELTSNATQVRTRSMWADNQIVDNIIYDLADTPCDHVAGKEACVYHNNVQYAFPKDIMLQEMGIESYMGAPLFSTTGKPLGLIVVLNTQPIKNETLIKTYFELVVDRIGAEFERFTAANQLINQEKKLRDLVLCSSDFIWEVDENLRYSEVNYVKNGLLGYSPKEMLGKTPFDFMPPLEKEAVFKKFSVLLKKRESFSDLLNVNLHKDGHRVYLETSGTPIFNELGEFKGYRGIDKDITDRKNKELALELSEKVIETANEAVMVTDAQHNIIKVNQAFENITGFTSSEALGKKPSILKSGYHNNDFYYEMQDTLARKEEWEGEIWNRRKNGEIFPEWLTISAIKTHKKGVEGYVSLFSDISRRKKIEDKLKHQANYDALTGLANRNLLADRFSRALSRGERENKLVALLFIDLDKFKQVNDSLGHTFGDKLLKDAAKRISTHLRLSDTAARLGGDEFAVILPDADTLYQIEITVQKLLKVLAKSYIIDNHEIFISASIGITISPHDGTDIDTLLRNADTAMYKAKEAGRNTFRLFTDEMHKAAQERLFLENALRKAITNNEFVLHYQPVINAKTGKIASCEALIRWQHPDRGLIFPDQFIQLAEEMGLIGELGEWVLQEAAKFNVAVCQQFNRDISISVNVSSYQFKHFNMPSLVMSVIKQTGIQAENLVLEITESLMLDDNNLIVQHLKEIRELNVRLSLDDFGTGYSSLSYLQKYPLSIIKIDRAFVEQMDSNSKSESLVDAIISLSQSLELDVVAEGIETIEQAIKLKGKGCEYFQGYFYAKPLPKEQFLAFIDDNINDD